MFAYHLLQEPKSKRKVVKSKSPTTASPDLAGDKMTPGVITIWDSSDEEGGLVAAPAKDAAPAKEDAEPTKKKTPAETDTDLFDSSDEEDAEPVKKKKKIAEADTDSESSSDEDATSVHITPVQQRTRSARRQQKP